MKKKEFLKKLKDTNILSKSQTLRILRIVIFVYCLPIGLFLFSYLLNIFLALCGIVETNITDILRPLEFLAYLNYLIYLNYYPFVKIPYNFLLNFIELPFIWMMFMFNMLFLGGWIVISIPFLVITVLDMFKYKNEKKYLKVKIFNLIILTLSSIYYIIYIIDFKIL